MKIGILIKGCVWTAFLIFCAVVCAEEGKGEERAQFQKAVEESSGSVVLVRGLSPGVDFPFSPFCSSNTGFFVDTEGHVLTSVYAFGGCSHIEVVTADGARVGGKLVGLDQASGLALLKTPLRNTVPLRPAERLPEEGDWILAAMAQPAGITSCHVVYSTGTLSSVEGSLKLWGVRWEELLVSVLSIRPGGASAPLLDKEGRLVGVVLAVAHRQNQDWKCYGIRWKEVERIVPVLESGGRRLGWLGVAVEEPYGRDGAAVSAVLEKSPAFAAGIRPNDVLLAIDDQPIVGPSVLEEKIAVAAPGTAVRVKLRREQEIRTLRVRIGARPILISRVQPVRISASRFAQRMAPGPADTSAYEVESERCLRMLWEMKRENEALRSRVVELEERVRALEHGAP